MVPGSSRPIWTIYAQEKPNNAERDAGLLSMSTPIKSLKKSLLPVLVVVCALGGTIGASAADYDGTYSGSFSGNVVCVVNGQTIITPVPNTQITFTLTNGVLVYPPPPATGSVDCFGTFTSSLTRPGFAPPTTFIASIG